jgi:DNA-3-methyladenine glycosylase II
VTPDDYARARRLLLRRDPVLAEVIRRHGPCGLAEAQRADHFSALVRAITFQQLSTKAASTIYGRLVALMPGGTPTALALAAVSDDQLRTAGISRQKGSYLRDLCAKVSSGALDLDALATMDDEQVIDLSCSPPP